MTYTIASPYDTPQQYVDHSHSEIMRSTPSPQRLRYLQQVIDHEAHLPALSAKARLTMSEPARG